MKRAMGLVFAVLVFAVVVRADRMEYGGDYAARTGMDLWSQATATEALQSPDLLVEPGSSAFGVARPFRESDDPGRLTDEVFYSRFGEPARTDEGPAAFDSVRLRLDGLLGTRDDGRGGRFGIYHPEPFHRILGVEEVPEPGTLLLLGMGLGLLAVWTRVQRPARG